MTSYGLAMLLIDGDESQAGVIRQCLGDCKTLTLRTLDAVRSAGEARARLETTVYDVLLIEHRLGAEDGLALLYDLRRRGINTPAILLTGGQDEAIAVEALGAGAADFVLKPTLSPVSLAVSIRFVIELERRRVERERSDEALRRSEERFRALVENSSDVIVVLDGQHRLTYASRVLAKLLGYSAETILRKDFFGAVYPEDAAALRDAFERAVAAPGVPTSAAFRYRHRNGSWVEMEAVLTNRLDDPAVRGVVGNLRDVGQRRRAEEAFRQSEEKFRLFFENSPVANYVSTPAGRLLACNAAFAQLFGFDSVTEALAVDLRSLYWDPAARGHFLNVLSERGTVELLEEQMRRRDGRFVQVVENSIGSFDEAGELIEIHGHIIDDTARRKAEEGLRQSQKMEAIGRLAGGMAHDFNNLLTSILGYSELVLQRTPENDPRRPLIDEVRRAGERARALTGQLLAFSRRQVVAPGVFDFAQLLGGLEKMLGRLIGEDIELVTKVDAGCGFVRAAEGQIEQIIMNLAINARDAMPRGGRLLIEAAPVDEATADAADLPPVPHLRLAVVDSGIGISAEVREHLFEPFFTTKEPGKGTGLGLPTVYAIVRQLGGRIEVGNEPTGGARFTMLLPQCEEPKRVEVSPVDRLAPSGSETILLVEDDEMVRRLSFSVLAARGYHVLAAADGNEALDLVRQHPARIDLVLTDVVMPGMGGLEVADRVQILHPEAKVLYVSGYPDRILEKQKRVVAGVDLIQKPFLPEALLRRVRDVLDRPERRPAAVSQAAGVRPGEVLSSSQRE